MTTGPGDPAFLVERLQGVPVGCIGDVMLDRFVHGTVERISPEAPVPVLRVAGEETMAGGAGNVVRNLAALGARVRIAGVIGDDEAGVELRQRLSEADGIVAAELLEVAGRRTTVKTRFLAGTQQLLRADRETAAALPAQCTDALLAAVAGWGGAWPVAVLSDYAKGVLAGRMAAEIIARLMASGSRVVVDPKGADFGRYRGAEVITPNRRELAVAAGAGVEPGEEAACARALQDREGLGAMLVTLGRDGMLLVDAGGMALALPAEAREVFDVSGAGDTVAATLAAALAAGAPLAEAAALANTAAGIVVGKVGTAVVRARELSDAMRRRQLLVGEAKLCDLAVASEQVAAWRRQGLRIGFTNGCFDLIHPGHVSLLSQARAACDRLVVGLNTDSSVARLKGTGRPVQPAAARATVLASLAAVDVVVPFADDTPLALIVTLRPDVLVKGADYRLEDVVGAAEVQGWGGTVLLARLEPGFSTSATIAGLGAP